MASAPLRPRGGRLCAGAQGRASDSGTGAGAKSGPAYCVKGAHEGRLKADRIASARAGRRILEDCLALKIIHPLLQTIALILEREDRGLRALRILLRERVASGVKLRRARLRDGEAMGVPALPFGGERGAHPRRSAQRKPEGEREACESGGKPAHG